MLNNIFHLLCKIIQIIIYMFNKKTDTSTCRKIGVENILERTFTKLEKKYFKEVLVPESMDYFPNTKNSD